MPGAIALAGIFFVTVIEMVFSPAQNICRGGNHNTMQRRLSLDKETEEKPVPESDGSDHPSQSRNHGSYLSGLEVPPHLRDMGPLIGRSSSISRAINRMGEGSEEIVRVASAPEVQTHHEMDNGAIQSDVERHEDHSALSPQQKQKKETMQVYLLEMGILFHSVFIGMSLSVSTGKEFVILLVAIVFHRVFSSVVFLSCADTLTDSPETFEGLALGSRIASLPWTDKQLQPWVMSLAYGCTYVDTKP